MTKVEIPILERGQGIAPIALDAPLTGKLYLKGALKEKLGEAVKARLVPRHGQTRIRARIGPDVPAGEYEARLVAGKVDMPVCVCIPGRTRLRIRPAAVELKAAPGSRVSTSLTMSNVGNQPTELPRGGVAGLFASDGLASAFSAAYENDKAEPLEVFGVFISRLRQSYLGLMRLSLANDDKTPLQPGESREVDASFTIPRPENPDTRIGNGRRFHATFVLGCCRLTARLTIAPHNNPRKRKAKG